MDNAALDAALSLYSDVALCQATVREHLQRVVGQSLGNAQGSSPFRFVDSGCGL